jgi:CDP-glycerol glycerophosphotransferase
MPLWHLSCFFPRKKNIIIFGAWFGEKYSDNSMYLFEYACQMREMDCIWLTHKKSIIIHLKEQNKKAHYIWSLKGIWYSLRAGIVVVSSGKIDVNRYFINGATIINLWHGAPMKKIGKLDNLVFSKIKESVKNIVLPNISEYNIDYVLSTSKEFDDILTNAFGLLPSQIVKTGYPRNDVFFKTSAPKKVALTKVAYLPTFRDNQSNYNLFETFGFQKDVWAKFLVDNNAELYLGSHFASDFMINSKEYDNRIKLIPSDEFFNINEYLLNIDIVITDYSGIYFDFLLQKKPIILAPFDLDFYKHNCRELSFDYFDLECFGFAENWRDVMVLIEKIISIRFNENNIENKMKYNDYNNGESTKSLYSVLKSISNKDI